MAGFPLAIFVYTLKIVGLIVLKFSLLYDVRGAEIIRELCSHVVEL